MGLAASGEVATGAVPDLFGSPVAQMGEQAAKAAYDAGSNPARTVEGQQEASRVVRRRGRGQRTNDGGPRDTRSITHDPAEGIPMPHLTDTPDLSRPPVEITWSVPTQELAHQVAALMAQADRVANYVAGLPNRDDYEALLAENESLRQRVNALEMLVSVERAA